MTRPSRTPHETAAIDALRTVLVAAGHVVAEVATATDKPDWTCSVNGERLACECAIIVPEKVMRWSHTPHRIKSGEAVDVSYAYEPHSWLTKILEDKRSNLAVYKKNAGAKRAWLLVHTPEEKNHSTLRLDKFSMQLMKYAASTAGHGFDQIWVTAKDQGVRRIWRKGERAAKPKIDFSKGYPTRWWQFSTKTVKTDAAGTLKVTHDPAEYVVVERLHLRPIDPEYRKHSPRATGPAS